MAKKRRPSERVEPKFGSRAKSAGFFGRSKTAAKPPAKRKAKAPAGSTTRAKPAAKPAPKATAGKTTTFRRKVAPRKTTRGATRRAPARLGLFGLLGRAIRGTVYWSVVVLIIAVTSVAGLVGYSWSKLPPSSQWTLPDRPANVRIVSADGQLITNRADTVGQTLTLAEMPAYLPQAVIAIEDRRFRYHFGIDPVGLVRAFAENVSAGHIVQGGSTLTQQLAKNLFLTPERSFERKIQEVILAVWLEASLSKDEILELYLNRVYLGAGAYGVDAAAHRYFGKSARDVTLAEAAALAALLKAPSRYSPIANPKGAEERTQLVLAAMHEQGYITDREASLAMSQEIKAVRDVAGGSGRYVADWVMDQLPSYVGALDSDVVVETTIDLRMQTLAAGALTKTLAEEGATHDVGQGAFIAMDPQGGVKAMVGGRDYAQSQFNRAVDAHRQPGSAFKPFVYLAALESGMVPETVRIDQPVSIDGWKPENYSHKYLGPVTLQLGARPVAEHRFRPARRRSRPAARRRGRPAAWCDVAADGDAVDRPRHLGGDAARDDRRLRRLRQRRRGRHPACHRAHPHPRRRRSLPAAGFGPRPDDPPRPRRDDERHAADGGDRRHRQAGGDPRLAGGRQDRDQPGFP